ncbi:MAG: DMT family transporter [Candidatus Odinarchaeota archaeon]
MDNNIKKGLLTGFIAFFFVGLQPVIAILRPHAVDAYISGAMTCLVEAMIFLPIMVYELKILKKKNQNFNNNVNEIIKFEYLRNWRKNLSLLIFIGIVFSINQVFFFVGYDLAGAINGSLTQKTTVFFGIILGYLILKEKITKIQIIFSFILFFGLAISITQFFSLLEISVSILIGVGILLLIAFLYMIGHTLTKPLFTRNDATPIQMVFLRNFISGMILISTYLIFFTPDFKLFIEPANLLFFFIMGAVYGSGLICWYLTLSYLDVSTATTILAPTPISSALFASILLGEIFSIAHLVGTIIIIVSIIIIVNQK